jgi:hypothetical protein
MTTITKVRAWFAALRNPSSHAVKDPCDDGPAPCPLVNEPAMQEALCQARMSSYL